MLKVAPQLKMLPAKTKLTISSSVNTARSFSKNFSFSRTPSGVLTLRFHTDGGPATFTGQIHTDFLRALHEIGDDRDNRVLVVTGTGDRFMTDIDGPSLGDITEHAAWDCTVVEGRRVMQPLVDLEMPIVAAVNGPASAHSDYVLLADIVIAADTAVLSDFSRLTFEIVPGDGIHWSRCRRPTPASCWTGSRARPAGGWPTAGSVACEGSIECRGRPGLTAAEPTRAALSRGS
jgi:enoyl-CoA hydratase/carnithine racemase